MQKFTYDWRKSINITAWVIQLLVSIIFIGLSGYLLALVNANGKYVGGSITNLLSYVGSPTTICSHCLLTSSPAPAPASTLVLAQSLFSLTSSKSSSSPGVS